MAEAIVDLLEVSRSNISTLTGSRFCA